MAAESYRKPALALVQLPILEPYDGRGCPACGRVEMRVWNGVFTDNVNVAEIVRHICFGGRWGFLWLRNCHESRPHMHRRCKACGAKWLTAVKHQAYYEK